MAQLPEYKHGRVRSEIDVRRRAGCLMPPINATAQLRGSQYCAVAASLSKGFKSDTRERCF